MGTRSSDILLASRGVLTNDQLIVQFLEAWRVGGRSENTIEAYSDDLCDFRDFLGSRHISSVTRDDLRLYMDHLISEENKDSSIRRKQTCLKMFYRLMLSDGIIKNDPSVILEARKKARRLPDHLQLSGPPPATAMNATKEGSDKGLTASRSAFWTGRPRSGTACTVEAAN
jgi:hypothetical protein